MSLHERDAEDMLRSALRSAADSLEPSQDGLERIHARLTTPHAPPVAWITAVYSAVARRLLGGLDSVWAWLSGLPGPARQPWQVTRPGPQLRWHQLRMRLAIAVGAAVFAAAIGVSAVTPPLHLAIAQTGSLIRSVGSRLSGGTGGLRVTGRGAMPLRSGGTQATAIAGTQNHSQPSRAGCVPQTSAPAASSANPAAAATPTPAAILTPAATPTPCAAPASGTTPATSPSPSLSPAPPASPAPSATPSPSVSPTVPPSPSASPTQSASPSPSASPGPG
jgi:hypothetical protein